jgi:Phage integrase family
MEGGARSCPTGHGRALASIRIQTVLGDALQNAKTSRRWSEDLQGGPCVDLPDGDGESELGCTANPWRIPDARIRGIGNNHLPLDETSTQEPRTGQPLGAFLRNHREAIVAMDFFTVPTLTFNLLYCFFLISHDRRCILHSNVTQHPTSSWIVQQLREAFPYQSTPKFLILDHDAKYGLEVPAAIRSMNMGCVRTSIQSPWQNGIAERWVSSCRRELLDQIISSGSSGSSSLITMTTAPISGCTSKPRGVGPIPSVVVRWSLADVWVGCITATTELPEPVCEISDSSVLNGRSVTLCQHSKCKHNLDAWRGATSHHLERWPPLIAHRFRCVLNNDEAQFPSFRCKGNQPRTANMLVEDHLRPAAVEAGVLKEGEKVRFGFHNLRHSLASFLVRTKTDPKTVQALLRHSDVRTTLQLYAHSVSEDRMAAQGEMLQAILQSVSAVN